jgi:hypothetical protein
MSRYLNGGDSRNKTLLLLTGGKTAGPPKDAIDFFEQELLMLTMEEALKTWTLDYIEGKFRELIAISRSYGITGGTKPIGSIVQEIREKQANGKSVS